ncbi:MAG: ABC transporter substrate-binding protein [Armatimonadaceae bacterium]
MKRSYFIRCLTALSACLVLGLSVGCKNDGGDSAGGTAANGSAAAGAGNEILVGHFTCLTGENSTFGQETDEGVRLAMDQINAAGGVLDKQIKVDTQDDQSKPDEAKTVVTNFASNPEIVAVIGEIASTRSKNAAPVMQKAGIPMITPSSTNPEITEIGDYIFRVCFIDPFQGLVMAKFAREDLKAQKVGIMRDPSSDYSVGLADVFAKEFQSMGGTIIADLSFNSKDSDFRSQLSKMKDADAIFVPGYYDHVGTIAQQARELGIKAPLLGGDGWDSPDLVKGAGGPGGALEGSYFSNHYSKEDQSERVQKFIKEYGEKYNGKTPSGLAALGYDAMMVLADAIKRAGSTDRAAIRDAIAQTKDFPGVTGNITIDENRNANKPAVVLQIEGDKFVYKKTIEPTSAGG